MEHVSKTLFKITTPMHTPFHSLQGASICEDHTQGRNGKSYEYLLPQLQQEGKTLQCQQFPIAYWQVSQQHGSYPSSVNRLPYFWSESSNQKVGDRRTVLFSLHFCFVDSCLFKHLEL